MTYSVAIQTRDGDVRYVTEALLPGIIPDRILDMMVDTFVERELGICHNCPQDCHCHVLRHRPDLERGLARGVCDKLCPILFHDAARPTTWKVEDLA